MNDNNALSSNDELLILTDNAVNKVKELLAEEADSSNLKLRAFFRFKFNA